MSHFLFNCSCVVWIVIASVQQCRWRCTSTWNWVEEMSQRSLADKNLFFCCRMPSYRASILVSLCLVATRCSFVSVSSNIIDSKPLGQHRNRHGLPRLKPAFLNFLSALCFRISTSFSILMMVVEQLEYIFSIVCTNLCSWLSTFGLKTNNVIAVSRLSDV